MDEKTKKLKKLKRLEKYEYIIKLIPFFEYIKAKYSNYQIIFLSKRLFKIYSVLEQKYPEIKLPNYKLLEEIIIIPNEKNIYINDFNCELPKKTKFNDEIIVACQGEFRNKFNFYFSEPPFFSVSEEDITKIKENEELCRQIRCKHGYFYKILNYNETITFLAQEIYFLQHNNINDALGLVPEFLKNYFNFIAMNVGPLRYYRTEIIKRHLLEKNYWLIKGQITQEIIQKFKIEKITPAMKHWLMSINGVGYNSIHELLVEKDESIIEYDFFTDYQKKEIEVNFKNYLNEIQKTGFAPQTEESKKFNQAVARIKTLNKFPHN